MKLILDDVLDSELKDYLLSQDGIIDVQITNKDDIGEINITFDNRITPLLIMKYIELFQNNDHITIMAFDKGTNSKLKQIKYLIDDLCCEYCYKGLIYELFKNKYIKSVKSNFDFNKPAFNIELLIEYDSNYNEEELVKYINDNI